MKKRYRILVGLLALSTVFVIAGCGKKEEQEEQQTQVQVTVAPVTTAPAESENLVSMQQNTDENSQIANVMGTKSSTAASLVLINQTGSEISQIYIRPNTDDDEDWGEDLVKGSFKLGNGEKAVYYYEKGAKDDSGNTITRYDIRVVYTDTDKSECYFRKLPMTAMTEITLRMDGTGEDSIPYATYKTSTSSTESSTLNEVKQRLGLLDDDDDEDDSADSSSDSNTNNSDGGYEDPVVEPDDNASQAADFIGQPLENLTGTMGEATDGEDYVDEPVTGKTGYHYYDTFTVSTTVDDNGNEVVTGVW